MSFNYISKIEGLPKSLKILNLSGTKITKLENLHEGLEELDISSTNIRELKNLPKSLKKLNISKTEITTLDLSYNIYWLNLSETLHQPQRKMTQNLSNYLYIL